MKKIAVIMTAILLILSLASCGKKADTPTLNATLTPVSSAAPARPANWPLDDEYLAILPPIPQGLVVGETYVMDNVHSIMLSECNYQIAQEYAQTLKAAGFTSESSEAGYEEVNMYLYTGKNAEGYTVDMIFSYMTMALTVKK